MWMFLGDPKYETPVLNAELSVSYCVNYCRENGQKYAAVDKEYAEKLRNKIKQSNKNFKPIHILLSLGYANVRNKLILFLTPLKTVMSALATQQTQHGNYFIL